MNPSLIAIDKFRYDISIYTKSAAAHVYLITASTQLDNISRGMPANLLRARSHLPYRRKMKGTNDMKRLTKPRRLEAQATPNEPYKESVASGRRTANKLRLIAEQAIADAVHFS